MNTEKLKGHIPDSVLTELSGFDLTPLQAAHFLAQVDHESGGFKHVVENMNYTKLDRIVSVFRRTVDKDRNGVISDAELEQAKKYVGKPEALGNAVYANRMGNGDERSGSGYYRRGRGYIQLTGTDNQKAFFEFIGLPADSDPALISTKYPLESAYWFFTRNKIWLKCVSNTEQCVKEVTRMVNGGLIGLDDRIAKFKHYWELLK